MLLCVSPDIDGFLFLCHLQDNLSFPLIHPEWNADEEILLLEVPIVSTVRFET
jgi:hypothetical protein